MYDKAKRIRHGGNYLASWRALQMVLECSAQEAKKLLKRFYDFNPNLTYWLRQVSQQLRQDRTIISLLGRKRLFLGRFGDEMLRQAVAYNPQETVCHVVNLGINNIYDTLCKDFKGVSVKLQVHDSVLIEHPPDMKHIIHSMLPGLMKVILTCYGKEFFIPIEIKSGFNWKDLK
jgi:DNA polymerase I-like protein with 3'-5' exonuclease and polymerase domains